METFFVKYKVTGSLEEIREWASVLNANKEAVNKTLEDEEVAFEFAALDIQADGPYIVFAIKARDLKHMTQVFKSSEREIDEYHKAVMLKNLGAPIKLEVLIDFENFDAIP